VIRHFFTILNTHDSEGLYGSRKLWIRLQTHRLQPVSALTKDSTSNTHCSTVNFVSTEGNDCWVTNVRDHVTPACAPPSHRMTGVSCRRDRDWPPAKQWFVYSKFSSTHTSSDEAQNSSAVFPWSELSPNWIIALSSASSLKPFWCHYSPSNTSTCSSRVATFPLCFRQIPFLHNTHFLPDLWRSILIQHFLRLTKPIRFKSGW
jgi:hypothetical protein